MELYCVAVINNRTATGVARVPAYEWDRAGEDEREG